MVAFQKEAGPVRENPSNKRGTSTNYYESKRSSSGMALRHVMHEDDIIVMIFKVVGNDITNDHFSILKKKYRSLVSMLTFSVEIDLI